MRSAQLGARRRQEWFESFFDGTYVRSLREQNPARRTRAEVDFVAERLALRPGARILDVACGYGRHAGPLARRGFEVVGLDLSPSMIAEARRRWAGTPGLQFIRGDMRRMAFRAEFDAVINMSNSFGYFTPAGNRAAVRRMVRALRPGGALAIDHRDPRWEAALPARLAYRAGPRELILEERSHDRRTRVTTGAQLVLTQGRRLARYRRFRVQVFSVAEWRRMLRQAGLRLVRAYGGPDGRPFRAGATGRLIVVARSPAASARAGRR